MQAAGNIILAGPGGSFGSVVARNWFRIPAGSDVCHQGCAYTVLQTVQKLGVRSVVYGTVHYREPLKSFDRSSSPGVHITKNPNFDPISTFSYFHYKKLGSPNFL